MQNALQVLKSEFVKYRRLPVFGEWDAGNERFLPFFLEERDIPYDVRWGEDGAREVYVPKDRLEEICKLWEF